MRKITSYSAGIIITVILTALLHNPVGLVIYKIREPYFRLPLKPGLKTIIIRNDASGDGEFGAKRRNGRSHAGIDYKETLGAPVYAARSGTAYRGNVPTGYGKYVMIHHPDGYQTIYGHLSDWGIPAIKKVRKGELIGYVGKTGNAKSRSVESHLHFEIRKDGEPVDPGPLIR